MRRNNVYLEAPGRTQELLNIKWTLKSAGFTIGSTWHENSGITSALPLSEHWDAKDVEQLRACDLLVVICGKDSKAAPRMAMMAGLALARGLQIVWIGPSFEGLDAFRAVRKFNTAEDYEKEILGQMYSEPASNRAQRAA
jgi:hypothetical protein